MHDLVVLLQELLHLVYKIVRVFLRFAELVTQTINLFIKTSFDTIKVDMVALLILPHIYLEIA